MELSLTLSTSLARSYGSGAYSSGLDRVTLGKLQQRPASGKNVNRLLHNCELHFRERASAAATNTAAAAVTTEARQSEVQQLHAVCPAGLTVVTTLTPVAAASLGRRGEEVASRRAMNLLAQQQRTHGFNRLCQSAVVAS